MKNNSKVWIKVV